MNKTQVLNKWTPLLEAEGVPAIASATRKDIIAAILENQEQDIAHNVDGTYSDSYVVSQMKHLMEAVVSGDHGYNDKNNTDLAAGKNSGAAVGIGPAVMGMVRRAIPNMIAFDICGVQPMSAPTGQVFSLRSMYGTVNDGKYTETSEAFHPIAGVDAGFSGKHGDSKSSPGTGINPYVTIWTNGASEGYGAAGKVSAGKIKKMIWLDGKISYLFNATDAEIDTKLTGEPSTDTDEQKVMSKITEGSLVEISEGMATSYAETMQNFNGTSDNAWNEMSFRIDKQTIEAKSRQLKAQYSIELAQDLKAVHGISAESELANILAAEIMQEINREVILWINATAQVGKTGWTNKHGGQAGKFDFNDPIDTRGARWAGESYKSLIIQVDKEANEIARQTGRGAGNFIIASRNVVAAFGHTDMFVSAAQQGTTTGLNQDPYTSTFAGVLAGKYRVYIDQYAKEDYFTVGYKGVSEIDAGIYYCPYVALTPFKGADPKNFQPVLGFKTRYAIGINPFADSAKHKEFSQLNNGMPTENIFNNNCYFRKVSVVGL